jgi:hypothetical protein
VTTFAFAGLRAGDDMTDTCKPDAAPQDVVDTACSDADKALVIASVKQLADAGKASWRRLANGNIELCLVSGELFVLGEDIVTRLV